MKRPVWKIQLQAAWLTKRMIFWTTLRLKPTKLLHLQLTKRHNKKKLSFWCSNNANKSSRKVCLNIYEIVRVKLLRRLAAKRGRPLSLGVTSVSGLKLEDLGLGHELPTPPCKWRSSSMNLAETDMRIDLRKFFSPVRLSEYFCV